MSSSTKYITNRWSTVLFLNKSSDDHVWNTVVMIIRTKTFAWVYSMLSIAFTVTTMRNLFSTDLPDSLVWFWSKQYKRKKDVLHFCFTKDDIGYNYYWQLISSFFSHISVIRSCQTTNVLKSRSYLLLEAIAPVINTISCICWLIFSLI